MACKWKLFKNNLFFSLFFGSFCIKAALNAQFSLPVLPLGEINDVKNVSINFVRKTLEKKGASFTYILVPFNDPGRKYCKFLNTQECHHVVTSPCNAVQFAGTSAKRLVSITVKISLSSRGLDKKKRKPYRKLHVHGYVTCNTSHGTLHSYFGSSGKKNVQMADVKINIVHGFFTVSS